MLFVFAHAQRGQNINSLGREDFRWVKDVAFFTAAEKTNNGVEVVVTFGTRYPLRCGRTIPQVHQDYLKAVPGTYQRYPRNHGYPRNTSRVPQEYITGAPEIHDRFPRNT